MNLSTASGAGTARARISSNLKRLRQERGLSQERLAEMAEFHRTYVSQLERLATALGVDVVDLLRV